MPSYGKPQKTLNFPIIPYMVQTPLFYDLCSKTKKGTGQRT